MSKEIKAFDYFGREIKVGDTVIIANVSSNDLIEAEVYDISTQLLFLIPKNSPVLRTHRRANQVIKKP